MSVSALEVVNSSLGIIRLLRELGVDLQRLQTMQANADREGRELSDDELQSLADAADRAIDRLEQAQG